MPNALSELSVDQLKRAVEIKEQIVALQDELNQLLGGASASKPGRGMGRRSPAVRARMAAAQRARWAKLKGEEPTGKPARRRRMSAAGRAAIAAAARARWAKAKAAGKNRL